MANFLQYHEPGIVDILILVSFFTFLWVAGYISKKVIRAGIIGPIAVGIIYGEPLANILQHNWQETFLYLGYIGLILIIFEGGLTTRLDLLRANLTLSVCGAATGVILPIGFSYLLLYLGFGYGAVENFIVGAALSATSLGTTFAVISGASKTINLSQTRVGAVLVSAAVIDDVTGLVIALSGLTSAQSNDGYVCPITPPKDATALEFAYAVQKFLYNWYEANGNYSASMFSSFPNGSTTQMNGKPLSADLATNFAGLTKQAQLGVEGINMLSKNAGSGYMQPMCNDKYPPGFQSKGTAKDFVMSSYFIEATICGTFIGLADYVQTPQAAFLMARLAAEHGIHASFIGSYMKDTPYSADSMALTPAFTPQHVLQMGSGATMMDVGMLGQYIPSSCAPLPPAPCGGSVQIGDINAMLTGAGMSSGMGSSSGAGSMMGSKGTMSGAGSASSTMGSGATRPSSSSGASSSPQAYTGDASGKSGGSLAFVASAAMALAAAMMEMRYD